MFNKQQTQTPQTNAWSKMDKIAQLIVGMFTIFDKEITKAALEIYVRILIQFPLEEVDKAIREAILTCKYCPKPSDIVEIIRGPVEDKAEIEASKVIEAIGSVGAYASVVFDDPVTQAVIESYGGWIEVCKQCHSSESTKWFRLNFIKTYKAFSRLGKRRYGYLPGIIELQNSHSGYLENINHPIVVGDKVKAKQILEQGKREIKNTNM